MLILSNVVDGVVEAKQRVLAHEVLQQECILQDEQKKDAEVVDAVDHRAVGPTICSHRNMFMWRRCR